MQWGRMQLYSLDHSSFKLLLRKQWRILKREQRMWQRKWLPVDHPLTALLWRMRRWMWKRRRLLLSLIGPSIQKRAGIPLFFVVSGKSRLPIFRCPSVFTFLPVFYQFFIDLTLFWHLSPFQTFLIYFIDAVSLYHKHLLSLPSLPSYYNICHEPHFCHIW